MIPAAACNGCGRNAEGPRNHKCNLCRAAYMREWSARRTPEQRVRKRESQRAWLARTGKNKEYLLRWHYGITVEEYERRLNEQGGVCATCKQPEKGFDKKTGRPRALSVDHDHRTGRIRGLLCRGCNNALGAVEDKIETLAALIAYLRSD